MSLWTSSKFQVLSLRHQAKSNTWYMMQRPRVSISRLKTRKFQESSNMLFQAWTSSKFCLWKEFLKIFASQNNIWLSPRPIFCTNFLGVLPSSKDTWNHQTFNTSQTCVSLIKTKSLLMVKTFRPRIKLFTKSTQKNPKTKW